MPLSVPLPAGAKIIINGAVIENSGAVAVTLTVHNKANILRDKDVLTQAEADTPAKEIYHSVQNAYLFEVNREEWLNIARILMDQFLHAWPESAATIAHVVELMGDEKLYNALRASRRLIALEAGEPLDSVAHPGDAYIEPKRPAQSRRRDMSGVRDKITELEKRISLLDKPGSGPG